MKPAGFALGGGGGAAAGAGNPFGELGFGGAVVVVVVVVGGTVVVVDVVVVVVVVVEVVDDVVGSVGVGTMAGPVAVGSVLVVVVVVDDAGTVVVVEVAPEAGAVELTAADDGEPPSGADVSTAVVHAPAVCMVATSRTSLARDFVWVASSAASFDRAAATALEVSCTWSRAAWYAASAA